MLPLIAVLFAVAPPHRWVVAPNTPIPSVSAALLLARDGDTILVGPGDYHEPELKVTRRLTILGRGGPVFHGGDHQVFTVLGDSVTLAGLTIEDVSPAASEDRAAIKVVDAHGCRIERNTLRRTFFGIYLSRVHGCTVRGNHISGGVDTSETLTGNAIHSWTSEDLLIEDNAVTGHRDGIYFEFTTRAVVRHNTSSGQHRYGLHFMFSNDCRYLDNTFADNRAGVAVMYSRGVVMEYNRFLRSRGGSSYGLLLKEITDSRLRLNRFEGNTIGLYADGTNRLLVAGNEFLQNGWGVQVLADVQDAVFHHNRFEGNAFDVSTNSVNAASRFSENFWDRYQGYDLDHDGFGDVPYAPVRLFALVVQQNPPTLILLRSFFVTLLETAERVVPVLTPAAMVDRHPLMRWSPLAETRS